MCARCPRASLQIYFQAFSNDGCQIDGESSALFFHQQRGEMSNACELTGFFCYVRTGLFLRVQKELASFPFCNASKRNFRWDEDQTQESFLAAVASGIEDLEPGELQTQQPLSAGKPGERRLQVHSASPAKQRISIPGV